MHRPRLSPTEDQRAALLRFEALYEEWRVASVNLLEAERQLVAQSLRDGATGTPLGERVALLRAIEREAHAKALAAQPDALD